MRRMMWIVLLGIFSTSSWAQLTGTIKNAATDDPLQASTITFTGNTEKAVQQHAISQKKGDFLIEHVEPGNYSITVSSIGFETYQNEITLLNDSTKLPDIYLNPKFLEIDQVEVSSLRREIKLKESPIPMSVVTINDLKRRNDLTIADALASQPGISLSRDGIWGTSLKVRGLGEERLVLLIDGTRVETASDNAAAYALIDMNDIEQIEVIKGGISSLYGSGALGGVVQVFSKKGVFSEKPYFKGSVRSGYQSVNSMYSENISLSAGSQKWYFKTALSLRDAQNTKTPVGELFNSQFNDNYMTGTLGLKPRDNHEVIFNFQQFNAKDVGIPGGKAFPETATATYPKEERQLIQATYKIADLSPAWKEFSVKVYNQYILRDVLLKPAENVTITPVGKHTTTGLTIQNKLNWTEHNVILGMDAWQRNLETSRSKTIIKPGTGGNGSTTTIRGELPIPNSSFMNVGVFGQDMVWLIANKLKLIMDGRFDIIQVENAQALDPLYIELNGVRNESPAGQRITFEAGNSEDVSWGAGLGLLYHMNSWFDLTANASRSFRAPSLEERFKYIDLGASVRLGDPNLKPEQGFFLNLGGRIWLPKLNLTADIYVNQLTNLIVEQPGKFIYSYSVNTDQVDTLPALINANVNEALLFGYEVSAEYNIFRNMVFVGSSSITRGLDIGNDTNLPQIPPMENRLGFRYKMPKWMELNFIANFISAQNKIGLGETTTPGYIILDAGINSASIPLSFIKLNFKTGVNNLTNKAYLNHLSTNRGFIRLEPGRNIYIQMNLVW